MVNTFLAELGAMQFQKKIWKVISGTWRQVATNEIEITNHAYIRSYAFNTLDVIGHIWPIDTTSM